MKRIFSIEEAKWIVNQIGFSWVKYNLEQFRIELESELEYGIINPAANVTNHDLMIIVKNAIAHLNEFPNYYDRLKKINNNQYESHKLTRKSYAVDMTADTIVDPPFTETYQSIYKDNRRENNKLMLDY